MNTVYTKYLSASEVELLLDAEPRRLNILDEDQLGDLHQRIRRAGRKYRILHRRQAAAQVPKDRGRAQASTKNVRTAVKAEAFEDALARVSSALAKAARASARELKVERLAMASSSPTKKTTKRPAKKTANKTTGKAKTSRSRARGSVGSTKTVPKTNKKASSQAMGARRQAKRDTR